MGWSGIFFYMNIYRGVGRKATLKLFISPSFPKNSQQSKHSLGAYAGGPPRFAESEDKDTNYLPPALRCQ